MNRSKYSQSGFTLVEIAIVLVIIGLLLGGVLKGQELINNAKVKGLANEIKSVSTAYFGYQDRFRAIPGDDTIATTHLGATVNGVNILNATVGGTGGDGVIDTGGSWLGTAAAGGAPTAGNEASLFWMHTRAAGLMTGGVNVGNATNAVGGRLGIYFTSVITGLTSGNTFICSSSIDGRLAGQLDTTMDDGNSNTGSMQATAQAGGTPVTAAAAAAATYTTGTNYTLCTGL